MHRPQSVLMVFAISLLAIPIARASADPSIFTEAIPNSPPITGGPAWCSIAVDSWNTPHLSFGDLQDGVWHVKGGINGWTAPEPIDAAGGIATGIALDAFGRPSIAYIALTGTNPDVYTLKFARPLGSLWVVESVETGVYPTTSTTSLGLDAQGNPHIAYTTRDGNSFAVRYAKRYGGSWAIETVDPSASAPSLALDSAGRPHLAYLDATGSRLVYAHRIAGNWETENVESVVLSCALSLDANDRPHIVFGATHQEILTYAAKTGGSWTFETIDPAPNPGGLRVAIVVASDGTPQVTATQVAATQVRYGTRDGSSWQTRCAYRGTFHMKPMRAPCSGMYSPPSARSRQATPSG